MRGGTTLLTTDYRLEKVVDIPKIAIVGSQSAGKSSILEVSG